MLQSKSPAVAVSAVYICGPGSLTHGSVTEDGELQGRRWSGEWGINGVVSDGEDGGSGSGEGEGSKIWWDGSCVDDDVVGDG